MTRRSLTIAIAVTLLFTLSAGAAETRAKRKSGSKAPSAEGPVARPAMKKTGAPRPFIATSYTERKAYLISKEGKVEWEYETGQANDVWALPSGNVLFNTGKGVLEVTRKKEVVFSYESESQVYACQRLANGDTLVGECSAGRLLEIDPQGKIVFELRLLPEGKDGGHAYMRNARKLANGAYLVAHFGEQVVKEYTPKGKVVREIAAPGGPHSVARLPNGNTVIACGDKDKERGASIIEVDPKGKTVWEIVGDELPGAPLKFVTGFQRLPNGNTVLTNWLGHGNLGAAPQLIEVTRDKEVVWTFADHATIKSFSSVQALDVKGDATKGEIIH